MPADSKLVTLGGPRAKGEYNEKSSPQKLPTPKLQLPTFVRDPRLEDAEIGRKIVAKTLSVAAKAIVFMALMLIVVRLVVAIFWQEDAMLGNFMCEPSSRASTWTKWLCRDGANTMLEETVA